MRALDECQCLPPYSCPAKVVIAVLGDILPDEYVGKTGKKCQAHLNHDSIDSPYLMLKVIIVKFEIKN